MTASTSWLVVLLVCLVAVPVVYLLECFARPVTRRVRRWWRGRNLR